MNLDAWIRAFWGFVVGAIVGACVLLAVMPRGCDGHRLDQWREHRRERIDQQGRRHPIIDRIFPHRHRIES